MPTEGIPLDKVESEEQHFIKCEICGQMLDCRVFAEVAHHAKPIHERMPEQ